MNNKLRKLLFFFSPFIFSCSLLLAEEQFIEEEWLDAEEKALGESFETQECNHNCHVLPPYMVDKIYEYGVKHKKHSLVRLAKATREYAKKHKRQEAPPLKEHELEDKGLTSKIQTKDGRLKKPVMAIYDARGKDDFGTLDQYRYYSLDNPLAPPYAFRWEKDVLAAMVATLDFYWEKFNWNSINGQGADLLAVVNYSDSYLNAYYDGYKQVYGNPSNNFWLRQWFGSFTDDVDIAAHELTHGISSYKAKLIYLGQSGAINEHMSDVFGVQIKHYFYYKKNKVLEARAKWKIGDNVLLPYNGREFALRDMLNPGQGYIAHPILGDDPQPADFFSYVPLPWYYDNGGVHIYSGPLNRVFARIAERLGGNAWEKAGVIWYHAYDRLQPDATFIQLAQATILIAQELFGSETAAIVSQTWDESGVWRT